MRFEDSGSIAILEREEVNSLEAKAPSSLCGRATSVHRFRTPAVGPLSLREVETLVRSEWRRRLGSDAYVFPHPPSLVRALILYALNPADPGRAQAAEEGLWEEAMFKPWGQSHRSKRKELLRLSQAIWDALGVTSQGFDRNAARMERIDAMIGKALDQPAREPVRERP